MRLLLPLLVIVCLVVFVVGLVSPRRGRRAQNAVAKPLRKAEGKGDRNAGRLGDFFRATTRLGRRAVEKSGRAGRWVHDKVFR